MTDTGPESGLSELERISAAASAITDLSCQRDFEGAERAFEPLRAMIAETDFRSDNERHLANLRYHDCAGRHWALRAVHAFTAEVDPIDSNTYSLRAIDHHEQALENARAIELGDAPEQDAAEAEMIVFHEAQVADARGMQGLSAGEVQLKSGQFARAKATLEQALENLGAAETVFAADARKNNVQPDPGFSDVAQALLEQTKAEMALISGALDQASAAEKARAAALEAATRKHAISELSTSDYFSRRLKHDAEFAHSRAQLFRDAHALRDRKPWFASYLFFVLAIGSAVALVYFMGNLEVINNPFVIGLIFVFVFVIAGVATRLGKWSEGAELLASLTRSAQGGGESGGEGAE